jgi:hypothetical protein
MVPVQLAVSADAGYACAPLALLNLKRYPVGEAAEHEGRGATRGNCPRWSCRLRATSSTSNAHARELNERAAGLRGSGAPALLLSGRPQTRSSRSGVLVVLDQGSVAPPGWLPAASPRRASGVVASQSLALAPWRAVVVSGGLAASSSRGGGCGAPTAEAGGRDGSGAWLMLGSAKPVRSDTKRARGQSRDEHACRVERAAAHRVSINEASGNRASLRAVVAPSGVRTTLEA